MTIWCSNCGMGEDCIGFSKMPKKSCACFIPIRFDGSVKSGYFGEEDDEHGNNYRFETD